MSHQTSKAQYRAEMEILQVAHTQPFQAVIQMGLEMPMQLFQVEDLIRREEVQVLLVVVLAIQHQVKKVM